MRVIQTPARLKLATWLLLLAAPLVGLEVIFLTNAEWWKLPLRSLEYWCGAFGLLAFSLGWWMREGKRWALRAVELWAVLWLAASVALTLRYRNAQLGFFTLGLCLLWVIEILWLRRELTRSFFDPLMDWYQGLPKTIAGLSCELRLHQERLIECGVTRMDSDGIYVLSLKKEPLDLQYKEAADLVLTYRGKEIQCRAMPITVLDAGDFERVAAGFQFAKPSGDSGKNLGDFVEVLRGEGHVS